MSEASKIWNKKNPRKMKKARKRFRQRLRLEARCIKTECGCATCCSHATEELEFHHIGSKCMNVSRAISFGSRVKMLEEISKCQVLCKACHKKTPGYVRRYES